MNIQLQKGFMPIILGIIAILAIIIGAMMIQGRGTPQKKVSTLPASITVMLYSQNDSGQTGTATITYVAGKAHVKLIVDNSPADVSQPAHIHTGSCSNLGGVDHPLNNVVNGSSETMIESSIDHITSHLPLAINVHKSTTEASIYVSCGDIVAQ